MKEKLLELIITYGLCMGDDEEGFSKIIAILGAQQSALDAARLLRYPFAPGTGLAERARLVEALAQLDALKGAPE